jgi:hypothetical protein
MCRCEFCHCEFEGRPQVKHPRACPKPECQRLRQRTNEREWRERHEGYADARYHSIRRDQRKQRIEAIVEILTKCLSVGKDLLGMKIATEEFKHFLAQFLLRLGVRQINKFWPSENIDESNILRGVGGLGF